MNPISVYEYVHEHLPRQVFSDLQSRVGEIVKSCFQQLETFFSWAASSFSKWLYKTDVASTCENSTSPIASLPLPVVPASQDGLDEQEQILSSTTVESLDFESSFENLTLQCCAASPEDDLVDHAMTTLKLAHTQGECAVIRELLESLELEPKLFSCIEMATRKEQALDPNFSETRKIYELVLLAQESVESRLVITEGDFRSIEPICASYEGVEDTIAPYDLFLLALHSEVIFTSLGSEVGCDLPTGLIATKAVIEQILALLKGQRLDLDEDEQAHLLEAVDLLLLNQQAIDALFPYCLPFLKNEERTLDELAYFIGFAPVSCKEEMDQILSDALWKAILNLKDIDIDTIESFRAGFCSSHSFPRAKKAFSILAMEAVERNQALIDELGEFPFLHLSLSENNLSLLQNPFVLKNVVNCDIQVGSDDFYRRAFHSLQSCNLERLPIRFKDIPLRLLKNEYQENQEILLACLKYDSEVFHCASDQLKNDRDFVLATVQSNGLSLQYTSDELKNDREVVLAAVQSNGWAFEYASDELKNDRDFVLAAVQSRGAALQYASDELKNDREVVLAAVQSHGHGAALQYASDEFRRDRDLVLAAVQSNGLALQYASDELKNDRDLVLAAIQRIGFVLHYASDELQNDRDLVLAAVQRNGLALQYTSDEFRRDREVVLTAVQRLGRAFFHASDELKNDREVVLAAARNNGLALQYTSDELKNDREVVLAVARNNGLAFFCASDELKNDREVLLTAYFTVKFASVGIR